MARTWCQGDQGRLQVASISAQFLSLRAPSLPVANSSSTWARSPPSDRLEERERQVLTRRPGSADRSRPRTLKRYQSDNRRKKMTTKTVGQVTTKTYRDVVIHSYLAPEESLFVNTQVVETSEGLVVFDAGFLNQYCRRPCHFHRESQQAGQSHRAIAYPSRSLVGPRRSSATFLLGTYLVSVQKL